MTLTASASLRRKLVVVTVLVCGWVAAGVAQPSSAKTPPRSRARAAANDSNQVLVRVGTEAITRGDVQRRIEQIPEQFRATYTTPEGRQQVLERMVEERVWLISATKAGVDKRSDVRQQLEQQRRDLLVRTYLNEVMAKNPAVSDSEARVFYDEHLDDYRVPATVTLRHILSKKESDSKRVLQFAKARNANWDDLVKRFSVDTLTLANGGSLGTVTKEGQFPSIGAQPALAESAFKLTEGAIGGPYRTDKGWHVIKVESVKEESVRPFDQVKQMIVRQQASQRQQDFYKERLDEARKTIGVKPDSNAIQSFLQQRKGARELFNEAQALANPQARIEAYRKLLAAYPDSEVAPQAQFMIGFINSEELKNYDEAESAFRTLLARWPKAELATSAHWMIEHMRSEEVPEFINLEADSSAAVEEAPNAGKTPHRAGSPGSTSKRPAPGKP